MTFLIPTNMPIAYVLNTIKVSRGCAELGIITTIQQMEFTISVSVSSKACGKLLSM
jgi:hypothetical protein